MKTKQFKHVQTGEKINGTVSPCGTILHANENRQIFMSEVTEVKEPKEPKEPKVKKTKEVKPQTEPTENV